MTVSQRYSSNGTPAASVVSSSLVTIVVRPARLRPLVIE
jgi:hypothetical protein